MTLGQKIRELRKAKGLSQKELAEKIGITKTQISRWEQGHVTPRKSNIQDMAKVLGVPPENFQNLAQPPTLQLLEDDPELLEIVVQINMLNGEQKRVLKHVLQSMVTCQRLQDLAAVAG